jgi:hypothetical protein
VDLVVIVVLVHGHAKVLVSVPVNVFLKNLCNMVGVLPPAVPDANGVNKRGRQSCFQRTGGTLL